MQPYKVKNILRLVKNNQLDISDAEILIVNAFFEVNHSKGSAEIVKSNNVDMFM